MGSYAVTPSGQSSGNYEITYVDGVLSIGRGLLTITADDAFKTYGDALAFSGTEFTVSGLLEGDSVDGVTLASAGAAAAADVASGPYPILASDAVGTGLETEGEPNYDIAYVPGALTVAPAPLTIAADDASRPYGAENPDFTRQLFGPEARARVRRSSPERSSSRRTPRPRARWGPMRSRRRASRAAITR